MVEIKEVPENVKSEIADLAEKGLALLGIPATTSPKDIVAAITEFIRDCKLHHRELSDEKAYALGALLGCQYVNGLNWHWGSVVWDFDEENGAIGTLSADNSLFNNPIGWVFNIIESDGGVPFMLSYNMIIENQVPVFDPGSATPIY